MKKATLLLAILIGGLSFINAQNTVTVDANAVQLGYANVFELDGTTFVFGQGWGVPEMKTVVDTGANTLTLQPNFNTYGDNPTDPFWVNQTTGEGNKVFEGNTFVEDPSLAGSELTFEGSVSAFTIDPAYTVVAFIKVFNADFSVLKEENAPLTGTGNFTVTYTNVEPADTTVQYGFKVTGVNANPADEAILGSVVVNEAFGGGLYCKPTALLGCNIDGIKQFVLETINADDGGDTCNTEPAGSPQGYADRTALSTDLSNEAGSNAYIVQAQQNWPGGVGVEGFSIWIDFDDSGTFEASERLISGELFTTFGTLESFTLTIPVNAALGPHRLRAKAIDTSAGGDILNPCSNFDYGEVQDYTVNITSTDTIDPVAICQNITVQLDNNGFASINGVNIDGGSTDNVGIVSYTAVPNTFSCNDLGANAVTLIVADAAGNTDTCTAIVTVQDNLDPNVIGQNATGSLNGTGTVTIPVSSVNNGSTDNCTLASLTLTPNTFTSIGTYPAVLEGTDTSGNSDDVTVIITITDTVDNVDPTAICQNITVQLNNSGTAVINGNSIDGGSFDNIGIVSYTAVPDSFNCSNLGTNAVTLIVADAAGNTDTCVAIVTVEDNLNPNVIGQNATGNLNGTGSVTIPVSSVDAGSTDNCGIANLTLTPNTFTNVGTYAAVLEGTDTSGNSGFANVTITIIDTVDNIDPIAVCQNITVQLNNSGTVVINGNSIDGGSTDNIGIVSYTAVPNTFNCSNIGTNAVTLLVADAAGNTDTCIAIVTVEDNLDPNVIGQNAEGNLNGTGSVTIPVSSVDLGSTDNCGITSLTLTPDTFTSIGTYTADLEGTDASGNSDSVTVIINIEDSTLGIIEQEITRLTIYPNPANTSITINTGNTVLLKKVEIYDIAGKLLISKIQPQPSQAFSVNISELSSSIYFVAITDHNGKRVVEKIMKE